METQSKHEQIKSRFRTRSTDQIKNDLLVANEMRSNANVRLVIGMGLEVLIERLGEDEAFEFQDMLLDLAAA